MAKWFGAIGFTETVETEPGIYEDQITEKKYYGDVIRNVRRLQNSGNVIDDVNISNEISIVADPFANQNFHAMRYIEYMGALWKIESVEVLPPRLKLTLGGVYNGNSPRTSNQT